MSNELDEVVIPGSFSDSIVRRIQSLSRPRSEILRNGVATWLPRTLPDDLRALFSSSGIQVDSVLGGRLVMHSDEVVGYWSLELMLDVPVTDEEGDAIAGMLRECRLRRDADDVLGD